MHWLKTDFDKWKDEDESEDEDQMGGMGGMPGMGGMGGMPGMGGGAGRSWLSSHDIFALSHYVGCCTRMLQCMLISYVTLCRWYGLELNDGKYG